MSDQPDYSDGVMLALVPPAGLAARLSVDGGTPVEEFHLTVAYLGKSADVDKDTLLTVAKSLCKRPIVVGSVSGHGLFTEGVRDVLVALVDSADLEVLRRDAQAALKEAGIPVPARHGYTPHMTIKYLDEDETAPFDRLPSEPVEFQFLTAVHGMDSVDIPFIAMETAIAPYARTAYAQGWASSGGPMTERVQAGCVAAMQLCCENADDPQILEVALHLGRLEGIWAKVFERRFRLIDQQTVILKKAWRELTANLDVAGAVEILRQQMGMGEAVDRDWLRRAKATAREAAMRLLQWLPGTNAWQDMRDAVRVMVASGRAEGYADAVAIAATGPHPTGKKVGEATQIHNLAFDFDLAFQHAYDALENLGETWAESDVWLERMLGAAADEFGRTLGDLVASQADYSQMIQAGLDVLQDTVTDEGVVGFITDWALSTGMSRGAMDLYRSENVEQVTWMTAGDDRVCPVCEQNGEDSPFPIGDFPDMPAHPRCRCVASAEFSLTPAYDAYF